MPRYALFYISKLSKFIGTIEAANETEALNQASDLPAFQLIGGACHQCTDNLGDADDGEFVAHEETP